LLRNKEAASPLIEFTKGAFQTVIGERDESIDPKKVTRIIMCSGKVYYDLAKARADKSIGDVAIIRIEQLYPFPMKQFEAVLKKYSKAKEIIWAQEEPENMGAWNYLLRKLRHVPNFDVVARSESGSPATGSSKRHAVEQKALIEKVLGVK
jgi:2-oxoglutarate dehydrogenase E1 component